MPVFRKVGVQRGLKESLQMSGRWTAATKEGGGGGVVEGGGRQGGEVEKVKRVRRMCEREGEGGWMKKSKSTAKQKGRRQEAVGDGWMDGWGGRDGGREKES